MNDEVVAPLEETPSMDAVEKTPAPSQAAPSAPTEYKIPEDTISLIKGGLEEALKAPAVVEEKRGTGGEAPAKAGQPDAADTQANTGSEPQPTEVTNGNQPATVATPPAAESDPIKIAAAEKAELEQLRAEREQAKINHLNRQQQEQVSGLMALMQDQKAVALDIHEQLQEALELGDNAKAAKLQRQYNAQYYTVQNTERQAQQLAQGYQAQAVQQQQTGIKQQINAMVKDYGVNYDDLLKADPKLDVSKPNSVIPAIVKAVATKKDAEIASLKEAATQAEANAREKWTSRAPEAWPPRMGASAARSGSGLGYGNTDKLLNEGVFEELGGRKR